MGAYCRKKSIYNIKKNLCIIVLYLKLDHLSVADFWQNKLKKYISGLDGKWNLAKNGQP